MKPCLPGCVLAANTRCLKNDIFAIFHHKQTSGGHQLRTLCEQGASHRVLNCPRSPSGFHFQHRLFAYQCSIGALSALAPLVGLQEGHPACKKTEWWGAGVVICLERGADLHMAQLMPLPLTVSYFSRIQIGFTFLVPASLGGPRRGPLNGCVQCFYNNHSTLCPKNVHLVIFLNNSVKN